MPDFLGGALVLGLEDWLDCFSSVRTLSNTLDMVFRRASTAASIIFSNPLPSANSNEDEDEEEDEIGLTAGPGGLWEGAERLARDEDDADLSAIVELARMPLIGDIQINHQTKSALLYNRDTKNDQET